MERGGRREGSKIRPLPLRRMLYARVLQLRQEGLTHRKIQTKIAEELGVSISLSMISCWIRGVHTPFRDGCGRPAEDQRLRRVRPCPELAYVIGAVLGDGYTHYQGPHHYAVVLAVKDRDFAEEFSRCAAVALCRDKPRRPYWNDYMNLWYVNPCSKQLYMLLKGKDIDKVRPFIEHCSDCVHAFIRGLADAEGWVDIHIRKCRIYIVNTDRRLMEYTADLLKRLGIHATIYRRRMREIVVTGTVNFYLSLTLFCLRPMLLRLSRRFDGSPRVIRAALASNIPGRNEALRSQIQLERRQERAVLRS